MTSLSPAGPGTGAVPFAGALAAHGDRVALLTAEGEISYRDLAARVDAVARRLGGDRRLVLLAAANTVDSVVAYLAALAAGHPVVLVPGDKPSAVDSVVAAYDPDVVVGPVGGRWSIVERRTGSAHVLHPDLAALLSTSGSTGSAKLVRLSRRNLQANAESIAEYLGIRGTDRAAATLPLHYCYGLSVLNSHLLRGAALILTDRSVADPAFWDLFREHRGTALAGVPYTFDLLDRVGFATMRLPHLRYVTQAGGRLDPGRVRRYAALGRRQGWDLVVMYGQTEATARMAYLPADLAADHPDCIGMPVPGGSFRLVPLPEWPDPDTGELVYSGPNVMLGYAESPADLRLGSVVGELRTGDVARRTESGLYAIVGRRSRFCKIVGLRIDLDRVEAMLAARGIAACCAGDDDHLALAVEGRGDRAEIQRLVAAECGLPARAVRVRVLAGLPRLPSGKPDYRTVAALVGESAPAGERRPGAPAAANPAPEDAAADLRRLFAEVLGEPAVTDDSTFVSLGGDSLTYVEMSVRLERALGRLPADWHVIPVGALRAAAPRPARRRSCTLETSVALRAVAILLIVGTHARLVDLPGGAHLLLAVAGFNLARFHLTPVGRYERARRLARSAGRIAVPSMVWIAFAWLLTDRYSLANVFLVNYAFGPPGRHNDYWFVETLVYVLLAVAALLAVPLVDRAERRFPFGLPLALAVLGLVSRYQLVPGARLPTPVVVVWLVALGWAAARASTDRQRVCLTLLAVATVPGFHGDLQRELLMVAGMALLVWVPAIPSTRLLNQVAAVLAGGSLYIYLTHWQVHPHFADVPLLGVLASLAVGIGYAAVVARASVPAARLLRAGPLGARQRAVPAAGRGTGDRVAA